MPQLITLETLCRLQGTEYRELCRRTPAYPIIGLEIEGPQMHAFGAPHVYCGNVKDVHIFGHSYVKWRDTVVEDGQSFALDPARSGFAEYAAHASTRREGLYTEPRECIFIGGTWYDHTRAGDVANFGHFMFEFVSRLAIYARVNLLSLPVVVYSNIPGRWLDFLRLAGVREFITVDPVDPPNFANIWIASCPYQRDADNNHYAWAAATHFLRSRLIRNADTRKARRVYIGRGNATWRKVVNEPELIAMLGIYGFEQLDGAALSAEDQVRIMAESALVVAAQGAAPIITQFCPEHAAIIYLNAEGLGGYWGGWCDAIHLRQRFQRFACQPVENGQRRDNVFGTNELVDYRVDVAALERLVVSALQQ